MENRKPNFGNRKINQFQPQQQFQPKPFVQGQGHVQGQSDSSNMVTTIIITLLFLVLVYVIYVYGEKIYKYINENIELLLYGNNNYILLESEEEDKGMEKIKCKSGCVKGKCEEKGDCKNDDDCNLCVDSQGGFYGNVSSKDKERVEALEEEELLQEKRIKELEEMIKSRNKQIEDLNKYIDYMNKNKDKINKEKIKEIIPEEEKLFLVKVNHS